MDDFWLLFTDDDDLWHPCRTLVFRMAIASVAARGGPRAPVAVPQYSMDVERTPDGVDDIDVDFLMRNQLVGMIKYSPEDARERSFLEFWLHAVPARTLLDFIACTPHTTLEHGLCDIRFSTFLRDHAGASTVFYSPPNADVIWMYYHRQHGAQLTVGLKSAADVTPADVEVAQRLRTRLGAMTSLRKAREAVVAAAGGAREQLEVTHDLVAQFVAEVRRDVEMLVLYGQIANNVIVEATLTRQHLLGTPDESVWAAVAAELAEAAIPVLAPPGWVAFGDGGWHLAAAAAGGASGGAAALPGVMPGGVLSRISAEDEAAAAQALFEARRSLGEGEGGPDEAETAASASAAGAPPLSPRPPPLQQQQPLQVAASAGAGGGQSSAGVTAAASVAAPAKPPGLGGPVQRRRAPAARKVVGGEWVPGWGDVRGPPGIAAEGDPTIDWQ